MGPIFLLVVNPCLQHISIQYNSFHHYYGWSSCTVAIPFHLYLHIHTAHQEDSLPLCWWPNSIVSHLWFITPTLWYLLSYPVTNMVTNFKLLFFLISITNHNAIVSPTTIKCALVSLFRPLVLRILPYWLFPWTHLDYGAKVKGSLDPSSLAMLSYSIILPTITSIITFGKYPPSFPGSHQWQLFLLGAPYYIFRVP